MTRDLTRRYFEGNMDVADALARLRRDIYRRRKDLDALSNLQAVLEQLERANDERLLSPVAIETVRNVVAENGDQLRASAQAAMWAGHVVGQIIGVDAKDPAGRAVVQRVMRSMVKQGIIAIRMVYDARQGRDTPRIVVAGDGADQ